MIYSKILKFKVCNYVFFFFFLAGYNLLFGAIYISTLDCHTQGTEVGRVIGVRGKTPID